MSKSKKSTIGTPLAWQTPPPPIGGLWEVLRRIAAAKLAAKKPVAAAQTSFPSSDQAIGQATSTSFLGNGWFS